MRPKARLLRRALLASAALAAAAAPSCSQPSAPSYSIRTLRVIAVNADASYAAPGDTVTMRLTYADDRNGPDGAEPVQVTWLGGCIDPPGGDPEACYPALGPALSAIASGKAAPGIAAQELAPAERSGVPDGTTFGLAIPANALDGVQSLGGAPPQALAYAFFAVCAGEAHPISLGPEGGFPLECTGKDGEALSGESFVVGYTEVRVFADGRENQNPPISGLTLDGAPLGADPDSAPTVARCTGPDTRSQGCAGGRSQPCKTYSIEAAVDDVAEEDTESPIPGLRETVWANHFTDGGTLQGTTQLISDPSKGYQKKHATTFVPPAEPGVVTLWAVVHDNRGGASVARGFLRVE